MPGLRRRHGLCVGELLEYNAVLGLDDTRMSGARSLITRAVFATAASVAGSVVRSTQPHPGAAPSSDDRRTRALQQAPSNLTKHRHLPPESDFQQSQSVQQDEHARLVRRAVDPGCLNSAFSSACASSAGRPAAHDCSLSAFARAKVLHIESSVTRIALPRPPRLTRLGVVDGPTLPHYCHRGKPARDQYVPYAARTHARDD